MISPARRSAFEILRRVETEASFASELLRGPLTEELSQRDAGLCTELVLGALRWQGMLDCIAQSLVRGSWNSFDPEVRVALRMGLYQLRFLSRVPPRAAVHETVELVKRAGKGSAAGLVNAVLRRGASIEFATLRPPGSSDLEWLSRTTSHPLWLLERWALRMGEEQAAALALANNGRPVTFLRAASVHASAAEVAETLRAQGVETRPGGLLKTALAVERGNVPRTAAYGAGLVAIQDEASQLVPHLLDLREGQAALDLCAAPGNKAALLSQWAGPDGMVIACDLHASRLRQFVSAPGTPALSRVALDGEQELPFLRIFDRVLVDAPCSGTGTLRHNPELKWRLAPGDLERLAETQLRLLRSASTVLKNGGRLVYSTCSLEWEENQGVVQRFLEAHPEFRLLPLRSEADRLHPILQPAAMPLLDAQFLETSPLRGATDGFFAAILGRDSGLRPSST